MFVIPVYYSAVQASIGVD